MATAVAHRRTSGMCRPMSWIATTSPAVPTATAARTSHADHPASPVWSTSAWRSRSPVVTENPWVHQPSSAISAKGATIEPSTGSIHPSSEIAVQPPATICPATTRGSVLSPPGFGTSTVSDRPSPRKRLGNRSDPASNATDDALARSRSVCPSSMTVPPAPRTASRPESTAPAAARTASGSLGRADHDSVVATAAATMRTPTPHHRSPTPSLPSAHGVAMSTAMTHVDAPRLRSNTGTDAGSQSGGSALMARPTAKSAAAVTTSAVAMVRPAGSPSDARNTRGNCSAPTATIAGPRSPATRPNTTRPAATATRPTAHATCQSPSGVTAVRTAWTSRKANPAATTASASAVAVSLAWAAARVTPVAVAVATTRTAACPAAPSCSHVTAAKITPATTTRNAPSPTSIAWTDSERRGALGGSGPGAIGGGGSGPERSRRIRSINWARSQPSRARSSSISRTRLARGWAAL